MWDYYYFFLFLGYMGVACEQCMLGWSPTSDMKSCLKLASVQEVSAMGLASDNPTVGEDEMVTESQSGGINFLTVVIVVSLLSVVSYCMFHWWKNRTQPPEHRHHRLSTDAGDQHHPNNNAPSSRGSNPPLLFTHQPNPPPYSYSITLATYESKVIVLHR